jgi:hypothetical protein
MTVEGPVADADDRRKVKVIDRRWFTPEGQLREEPDSQAASAPVSEVPKEETPDDAAATPRRPTASSEPVAPGAEAGAGAASGEAASRPSVLKPGPPGFIELVDSLAQPALAFLSGQVPGRGRDLEAARYYIDLLGVLESKTREQLTLEEKNVLDDVLYQLRSLYVSATR